MVFKSTFLTTVLLLPSLTLGQDITPRNGSVEFLRVSGVGSYNYVCNSNNKFVFTNSTGSLQQQNDTSVELGTFTYTQDVSSISAVFEINGSKVRFTQSATTPSTDPSRDLPNALFTATSATSGALEGTTFMQRLNTLSGLGNTGACQDGDTQLVVFRADYPFFKNANGQNVGAGANPDQIRVPAGNVLLLSARGNGTYNYLCTNNAWAFVDYTGDLLQTDNNSIKLGSFLLSQTPDSNGGRIVFEMDGSRVTMKVNATAQTRIADSIPEVLLSTTSTTPGKLEAVTFGQDLNNFGGIKPADPCNAGDTAKSPFRGDYSFYVKG